MSISINWPTGVINVPREDMVLKQLTPVEIRELNLNSFRLTLKNLEDDPAGMGFLKTHVHNTEVQLGGLVFARVIEILEPYTVTFEDGQYTVDLVGANSNVGDRINANQVSVRSYNSAGLISNSAIEYSSFNGGVTIDVTSPFFGTTFPTGTPQQPVNNLDDAKLIADFRGFGVFYVIGNLIIDGSRDFEEMTFIGTSPTKTTINVDASANVYKCEFMECTLTGTLDGECSVRMGAVENLNYVNGYIYQCIIQPGTITLGGVLTAHFLDCWSGVPGAATPIINCGGSGRALAIRNYNGGLKITNKTGTDPMSVDLNSGQIILDNTVTNGELVFRGVGKVVDTSGNYIYSGTWNGATIINETLSVQGISMDVWEEPTADHITPGTLGEDIAKVADLSGITITGITASVDIDAIADAIWDEPLTAATHNITTSAGRRLRALASAVITEGEVLGATANTIILNGEASSDDGAYDPAVIAISEGTGYGQCRLILEYSGSTKTAVIDRDWKTIPDASSKYIITTNPGREHVNEGLLRGAGANTVILNTYASSIDNEYVGQTIFLRSGTGQDQACKIIAYNGTTKEATVTKNWGTMPDTTTGYVILPTGVLGKTFISSAVWGSEINNYTTDGTFGADVATVTDIANLSTVSGITADIEYLKDMADSNYTLLQFISDLESGKQVLVNNQLICYAPDNVTELIRFNLFDASNSPTTDSVYKRERV